MSTQRNVIIKPDILNQYKSVLQNVKKRSGHKLLRFILLFGFN